LNFVDVGTIQNDVSLVVPPSDIDIIEQVIGIQSDPVLISC